MPNYYNQTELIIAQKNSSTELVTSQTNLTQKILRSPIWAGTTLSLLIILIGIVAYGRWRYKKLKKAIKYEQIKVSTLEKRLSVALITIREWEENPDLINSRDCNLDYIRMRMQEPVFHNVLVNQAKVKVKQFISTAMRISLSQSAGGGIASKSGFNIDETFDITYDRDSQGKSIRRVLFRIRVKLTKLPTQSTSTTIDQIVECVEMFLSPIERRSEWKSNSQETDRRKNWLPSIQGHIVTMSWNQKAKPTPLLLLEQDSGGVNVSFRDKVACRYRTLKTRNY